jgi:hypothetical protein
MDTFVYKSEGVSVDGEGGRHFSKTKDNNTDSTYKTNKKRKWVRLAKLKHLFFKIQADQISTFNITRNTQLSHES